MAIRSLPVATPHLGAAPTPADATPSSISALPSVLNLSLYAGDDFALTLTLTDANNNPVDITAAAVAAQIRAKPGADILAAFTCSQGSDINIINLALGENDTQTLAGAFVWDCQVTWPPAGPNTTIVAGTVTITADVTRP